MCVYVFTAFGNFACITARDNSVTLCVALQRSNGRQRQRSSCNNSNGNSDIVIIATIIVTSNVASCASTTTTITMKRYIEPTTGLLDLASPRVAFLYF